jgi:hypothetical protein
VYHALILVHFDAAPALVLAGQLSRVNVIVYGMKHDQGIAPVDRRISYRPIYLWPRGPCWPCCGNQAEPAYPTDVAGAAIAEDTRAGAVARSDS